MDKWPGGQNGGNHYCRTEYGEKNEDSLRDLWGNIKHTKICIIGIPEREEREKRLEKLFEEVIVENFPNMGKETVSQVQVQKVTGRINPRRNMLRHVAIK